MAETSSTNQNKISGAAKATGAGVGATLVALIGGIARQADDVGRVVGTSFDDVGRAAVTQFDDATRLGASTFDDMFRTPGGGAVGDDFATLGDDALMATGEAPVVGDEFGRATDVPQESHSLWSEVGQQAVETAAKSWLEDDEKR
jgi:hypothetical protein